MSYDTTALLSRLRLHAILDGTEDDYTDAVLLDLCDQATAKEIKLRILAVNADYYLTYSDYAITVGRHRYPIPYRATLGKIHSLWVLNTSKSDGQLLSYTDQRYVGIQSSGSPVNHTIVDNNIVLGSLPSTAGYLRIYYPYSPSLLVATTSCMLVTSRTGGKLNGTPPGSWTTSNKFDVVSGKSPFELIHPRLTASSVTGGITFTESELDTNRLDDGGTYYVTLEEETCFPMMPKEFHYILAELAACPVLHNQGDEGWSTKYSTAQKALIDLASALIMRKQTEHKPAFSNFSYMEYFS